MNPRDYLASLEFHGIKLGLDNIRYLLECAANPHTSFRSIHVAGSNGKGSVVAALDAMFRAAGYSTGRFTSPHLRDLRERFSVDGAPIDDAALDAQIEFFRDAASSMDHPATFFEMNTAIAFRYFAQRAVDIALVETGMGGRFDSTNVLDPEAAVITNVSLEHTRYLGETLEAIAFEKAGILKRGRPAVLGKMDERALNVVINRAHELDCPVQRWGRDFDATATGTALDQSLSWRNGTLELTDTPLGLPGRYQAENAALAIAVAQAVREEFPQLTPDAIEIGLQQARWPGRLDRVLDEPPVILDVSHNPAGMRELVRNLDDRYIIVFAVASDKDAGAMIEALAPLCASLILTQFDDRRAMDVDRLRELAPGESMSASTVAGAVALAFDESLARSGTPILATGSFYTVGEAHAVLEAEYGARPFEF